jgi:hypothetical protein
MDKIDEHEILEKLEMLEEIEWIGQGIIETTKRIYDIPQKEKILLRLVFEALVSLPWIIKRDQEEIKRMLSYKVLYSLILAEIPSHRRDRSKEYRAKVESLELSPVLPEELRRKLIPEIEIDANNYGIKLEIPCREGLPRRSINLEIRDEIDIETKPIRYIILISLRDVLWLALTLSDRDIERIAREIMRHSKEDSLLFTVYGATAKKARQLLLSNPDLIEEAVKRRAEIEMKREKWLEELLKKQNISQVWMPSDRTKIMREALKYLKNGEDPEKILKRRVQGFNCGIAISIDTEERRYKPYRMGMKEETKDPKLIFNQIIFGYLGIDLVYGENHQNPVVMWRKDMTVEDVLNILTNITKQDLERGIAAMKNIAIKAEVIAEYIEKLRSYASQVVSIYKYHIEELEKQTEKKLRTITI